MSTVIKLEVYAHRADGNNTRCAGHAAAAPLYAFTLCLHILVARPRRAAHVAAAAAVPQRLLAPLCLAAAVPAGGWLGGWVAGWLAGWVAGRRAALTLSYGAALLVATHM